VCDPNEVHVSVPTEVKSLKMFIFKMFIFKAKINIILVALNISNSIISKAE